MVTEYNRNTIMRRRLEAEKTVKPTPDVAKAPESEVVSPVDTAVPAEAEPPKKTDAEKIKRGRK